MPLSPQAKTGLIAAGIVGIPGAVVVFGVLAYALSRPSKPTDPKTGEQAKAEPRKTIVRPTAEARRTTEPAEHPVKGGGHTPGWPLNGAKGVPTSTPDAKAPGRHEQEEPPPDPPAKKEPPAADPPKKEPPKKDPPQADPPRPPAGSTADLLAELPTAAHPDGDAIEWAACQKWCEENLTGRAVTWTAKVTHCQVSGTEPFAVLLFTDLVPVTTIGVGVALGDPVKLGKTRCAVVLGSRAFGFETLDPGVRPGLTVAYPDCTADEAKQLRQLKGKKVTFRAEVSRPYATGKAAEVDGRVRANRYNPRAVAGVEVLDWLPIRLHVSTPSADGILPAASK